MIRMLAFARWHWRWLPPAARAAEMTFYQLPAGAFPHDVAPPGRHGLDQRPAPGICRPLRSEDRSARKDPARAGRGAAWRHRRARRQCLADRRRAERHRAGRRQDQSGQAVPAAEGVSRTPISTRCVFDKQRHGLVHRSERRLWPRRSRRPARWMRGRRRRAAAPTASPRRPRATSGTPRSPATISPASIPRPARRPSSIRRARASARAASGRTPRACCG